MQAADQREAFVEGLVADGTFDEAKGQRLKSALSSSTLPIDKVIVELGFLEEKELAGRIAAFLGLDFLEALEGSEPADSDSRPEGTFMMHSAIAPLNDNKSGAKLAMADPFDQATLEMMNYYYGQPVTPVVATRSSIVDFLTLSESANGTDLNHNGVNGEAVSTELDLARLEDSARQAPVVRFVNEIIVKAVDAKATDIHLEPWEDKIRVRFRRDGVLVNATTASKSLHAGLVTRIKLLARLNISESRLPQDGRMQMPVRGQEVDMRVSVMPSIEGETIVLRLLEKSKALLDLAKLGFAEKDRETLQSLLDLPNGIVLVTGPTGSGKTTTLYTLMHLLNRGDSKIFTVEDPVEYRIEGISQLQVNPAIGLDFARALRSVLRQDPDTILVGEIRDRETAKIAIEASLTGHLVFSTLHTNTAMGGIVRLREMGIESYLLGSSLRAIIGQRLVRKRCADCHGQPDMASKSDCQTCGGSGYAGRTVLYELLKVDRRLSELVTQGASQDELEAAARQSGLVSMAEQGRQLVERGITDAGEIARATQLETIA